MNLVSVALPLRLVLPSVEHHVREVLITCVARLSSVVGEGSLVSLAAFIVSVVSDGLISCHVSIRAPL